MAAAETNGSVNLRPITPEMLARGITREMDLGRIDAKGVRRAYEILEDQGRIPSLRNVKDGVIEKDGCKLNYTNGIFFSVVRQEECRLTPSETAIVRQLMVHSPQTLTRAQILDLGEFDLNANEITLNAHLNSIRNKADFRSPYRLFHTNRGRGYYFQYKP